MSTNGRHTSTTARPMLQPTMSFLRSKRSANTPGGGAEEEPGDDAGRHHQADGRLRRGLLADPRGQRGDGEEAQPVADGAEHLRQPQVEELRAAEHAHVQAGLVALAATDGRRFGGCVGGQILEAGQRHLTLFRHRVHVRTGSSRRRAYSDAGGAAFLAAFFAGAFFVSSSPSWRSPSWPAPSSRPCAPSWPGRPRGGSAAAPRPARW